MVSQSTIDVTAQRLFETEAAIREQRRHLEGLTDPALRAVAARTLTTLEDMLLIMTRTQRLLAATRSGAAKGAANECAPSSDARGCAAWPAGRPTDLR